jgi:DNA (cytosine-5)-methyltransferase 1
MKEFNVLNLYACLGGNRYKWDEVAEQANINLHVTAIELDPEAARLYKERFPKDEVIVADAHQYLLDHYKEFDFIWSSPPCPSHSRARISSVISDRIKAVYPDFSLYQQILLLKHFYKGKFCIENVIPYYEPLVSAQKRDRHLYWTNFTLPNNLTDRHANIGGDTKDELNKLCKFHNYDFRKYKGTQSVQKMARNLVDYEAGRTILETALGVIKKSNVNQIDMFA